MAANPDITPGSSRQDRAYNFISCLIDATGFPLGYAFFSTTTILPILLRRLGATDISIGCLPAVANLLTFAPGFLIVGYLNRLRHVRGYLFWVAIVERLFLLPLAGFTAVWGVSHPGWLIAAVFGCITCHTICMGLNQPAYWMAVGKTVPAHWRGRLFGYAGALAAFLSIGVARVMSLSLGGKSGGFPMGFSSCFLIGFTILMVSVLPLGALREPAIDRPPDFQSDSGRFMADLRSLWGANHGFRRFLYGSIAIQLSSLATPFYILYAERHLGAGPEAVAGFTGMLVFATSIGGWIAGPLADRFGCKRVLLWSAVLGILAPIGALCSSATVTFYGVFAALALSVAGSGIAGFNIVIEFAPHSREIPMYTATANFVTALPRAIAPIIGGMLASATGTYRGCFLLSAAIAGASLILTARTIEPRTSRTTTDIS